jgi:hypothetical protein
MLKFVFKITDSVIQLIIDFLKKCNNHKNKLFTSFLNRLKFIVNGEGDSSSNILKYYGEHGLFIYGTEIRYNNEVFYFPLPIAGVAVEGYTKMDVCNFPTFNTAYELITELNEDIERYKTCNDYIIGFTTTNDLLVLISNKNIKTEMITDHELADELYYDVRNSFKFNQTTVKPVSDLVTKKSYDTVNGKMVSFALYTVIIIKKLAKLVKPGTERSELINLLGEPDFINDLNKNEIIHHETKNQVKALIRYGVNPLDFVLYCDLSYFRTFSTTALLSLINGEIAKDNTIIKLNEDFRKNINPLIYNQPFVVLDDEMVIKYPKILCSYILSENTIGLVQSPIKLLIEKHDINLDNSRLVHVEFTQFSS